MVDLLLDRVSMQYGEVWAVRDVTMRVEQGEAVVLLGPSGSGKTTLLRLIAGLEKPTSGDVLFNGKPVAPEPEKRNVSMLFAENRLYPRMSARSNIAFPLTVRHTPEPEKTHRVEAEAGALGIERLLERMPASLSVGQSGLVNLAKAMVRSPGLFLIDEPFNAVDAKARRPLRQELRKIQQGYGATAVYATHDQEDAMTLGDRLVIIEDGSIRQSGPPNELYEKPGDVFVATFLGSPAISMLSGTTTAGGIAIDGLTLTAPGGLPGTVLVGVRPERWVETPGGVTADVIGVDDLGTVVYANLRTLSGEVTMRWAGQPPKPGARVRIAPESFHLFDPDTGHSLYHS